MRRSGWKAMKKGLGCKMSALKSKGEILEVERGSFLFNLTLFSPFYLAVSILQRTARLQHHRSVSLSET
jgi:hypothetical protein